MLAYVTGSMIGTKYDLTTGSILAVAATIFIYIVPLILPNDPVEKH